MIVSKNCRNGGGGELQQTRSARIGPKVTFRGDRCRVSEFVFEDKPIMSFYSRLHWSAYGSIVLQNYFECLCVKHWFKIGCQCAMSIQIDRIMPKSWPGSATMQSTASSSTIFFLISPSPDC